MKFNRSTLFAISALTLAMFLGIGVSTSAGRRVPATSWEAMEQMGDMPYDLHFIDMMIMHHQDGIELAQLAQTKTQNARVKVFAQKTEGMQAKDLQDLQSLRKNWYSGKPLMDTAMMNSMMQSMHPGMMSMDETRRKLRAAEGAAFDRMFLETMIKHHQMAVDMSQDAATTAEHPELRQLARKGLALQQTEIAEMKTMMGGRTTTPAKPKAKAKPMPKMTHMH